MWINYQFTLRYLVHSSGIYWGIWFSGWEKNCFASRATSASSTASSIWYLTLQVHLTVHQYEISFKCSKNISAYRRASTEKYRGGKNATCLRIDIKTLGLRKDQPKERYDYQIIKQKHCIHVVPNINQRLAAEQFEAGCTAAQTLTARRA